MLSNNIFKGVFDAVVYLVLYIVVPVAQFRVMLHEMAGDVGSSSIISMILFVVFYLLGILYDCYGRYDSLDMNGKDKIILVGIVDVIILAFTIYLLTIAAGSVPVEAWHHKVYWLLFIPFAITLWDGLKHINYLRKRS